MKQPRYTPQVQLDMFAPVQLGLGIDPTPAKHLTEREAAALAKVILNKLGGIIGTGDVEEACKPYNLDAASVDLVNQHIPF